MMTTLRTAATNSSRYASGRLATTEGITAVRYYCDTRSPSKTNNNNNNNNNNKKKKKNANKNAPKATVEPPILPALFDADANMTHDLFNTNAHEVLVSARNAGVHSAMVPGTTVDDSALAVKLIRTLASTTPVSLFTCAGIHPYCVTPEHAIHKTHSDGTEISGELSVSLAEDIKRLKDMYMTNKDIVVAIGECGLDYSDGFPDKQMQIPVFRAQVELACELQLPLFMHERAAHDDFIAVLDEFKDRLPKVLVHCFTGTNAELKEYIDRGYFVSISGLVCKTPAFATQLREAAEAKLLPLDRVMVETDAPYMGFNGCRALCAEKSKKSHPNVPSALPMVVRALAGVMDVDAAVLAVASSRNAESFFGITVERTD